MLLYENISTKYKSILLFILSINVLLFPLIGIPFLAFSIILLKDNIATKIYIIIFAYTISLVNMIKIPTTDLATHLTDYRLLGRINFSEVFTYFDKDYIFFLLNKILFYLSNGNEQFFAFFWSFVFYFNMMYAIYILHKNNRIGIYSLVITSIFLLGTTEIFTLSLHILRQFTAGSLLIIAIVQYMNNNKNFIVSLFVMTFIHFSTIIFLPLFITKYINKKFTPLFLLTLFVLALLLSQINYLQYITPIVGSFESTNITQHIIGSAKNYKDDGNASFKTYIISSLLLAFLYYLIYKRKEDYLLPLFNTMYYSFIVFISLYSIQLLWLRFSFFQYVFYFIIFSIGLNKINNKNTIIIIYLFSIMYYLRLFYFFEVNHWSKFEKMEYIQMFSKSLFYFLF